MNANQRHSGLRFQRRQGRGTVNLERGVRYGRGARLRRHGALELRTHAKAAVAPRTGPQPPSLSQRFSTSSCVTGIRSRQAANGRSTTGNHSPIAVVDDPRRNPVACRVHCDARSCYADETPGHGSLPRSAASVPSTVPRVNARIRGLRGRGCELVGQLDDSADGVASPSFFARGTKKPAAVSSQTMEPGPICFA